MKPEPARGAIAFAERLLTLLDKGAFTATYKYAVLLAMMDVCLERTSADGTAPSSITTEQLADKVIELYWPHAAPFQAEPGAGGRILLQNRPTRDGGGQAAIVSAIVRFRERHAPDPSAPLMRSRQLPKYRALLRTVEWKLVEMPLPRLQQIGQTDDPFIYRITWDRSIRRRDFDDAARFDNAIRFVGDAGDHLVRLAGLLRPLIQRQWAAMVARFNTLPDAQLERFLFGAQRTSLALVRDPLRELQDNRCFYCDARLPSEAEVDHFVPWSRYPDNALSNLVLTDPRCNNDKRDHLAATEHVKRWTARSRDQATDLETIANDVAWTHDPIRSLSVARAIYLRLPDAIQLWRARRDFVPADRTSLAAALG